MRTRTSRLASPQPDGHGCRMHICGDRVVSIRLGVDAILVVSDAVFICVGRDEDIRDVMAIENTHQYKGLYHVLGGVISPIEGIGPEDLHIESLFKRIDTSEPKIEEVILALNPTMEGDTTAFYITKKLKALGIKVTTIARGIPIGGELEYADEVTLGRSILTRTIYD